MASPYTSIFVIMEMEAEKTMRPPRLECDLLRSEPDSLWWGYYLELWINSSKASLRRQ
jgi:hypothetical protein